MTQFLTVKEAAAMSRSSLSAVRSWIRGGLLKASRPAGGKVLIEHSELERFLRSDQSKAN